MKKVIPIIVLVLALSAAGYHLATRDQGMEDALYTGTVEATEVKISAEVMGRVLEVGPEEGDTVAAGQLLVRIDHETQDAQLAQAKAGKLAASGQYAAVKATEENIAVNLNRSTNLLGAGSISEQQFDTVSTQKKVLASQKQAAYGQIKQAEATAQLVRTQIARATVTAPIGGTVLARSVEPGEMVMPGTPLLTLADLEHCWVRFYIPETKLGIVKLGQKIEILSDSYPGKPYEGIVVSVAAKAEFTPKNVQTREERVRLVYGVKVAVKNPNGELKIGMPVDAKLE